MKKENNTICGIAVTVLVSGLFIVRQGSMYSSDDNYITPKYYN